MLGVASADNRSMAVRLSVTETIGPNASSAARESMSDIPRQPQFFSANSCDFVPLYFYAVCIYFPGFRFPVHALGLCFVC